MRATVFACALVCVTSSVRAAPAPTTSAYFWQPGDAPAAASAARAGYAEALRSIGTDIEDVPALPETRPALRAALEHAKLEYTRFAFAEASNQLDEIERQAEAAGGGDLDTHQLSDVYFYRWLCRAELGKADAAWDDLVQAARLAPGRVMDLARVPPRALSAWKRATTAVAALTRASLHIDVPADAAVRIDGAVVHAAVDLPIGRHFVRVEAAGLEAWTSVVTLAPAAEHLAPTLHARRAPDVESLAPSGHVLLGSYERHPTGWRFVLRALDVENGKLTSEALAISDDTAVRVAVAALVRRVIVVAPPKPVLVATEPPRRRTWLWLTVGGAITVAAAVAISLGVVYGSPAPSGTVSASLGGLK